MKMMSIFTFSKSWKKKLRIRLAEFLVVLVRQERWLLREIAMASAAVDLQENKHYHNSTLKKQKVYMAQE